MKETIKVIELLNKIANGEDVPEKIKYNGIIYLREKNVLIGKMYYEDELGTLLLEKINNVCELDNEIEIIEDDEKIEKLPVKTPCILPNRTDTEISHIPDNLELTVKINEIIDYINSKEK